MNAFNQQDNAMTATVSSALTPDKDWWRGAVIYQIYPRSYQDSNGDGIGDLKGITSRLEHIANLGADAIWISPFFTSPMRDFGYDVSNYVDVDPMFGTLADFDGLITEAHRLGIRVMIDLVLSHTLRPASLVRGKPVQPQQSAGGLVCLERWQAGRHAAQQLAVDLRWFGWQWDPTRMQYYMHNFMTSQPDLNLHNRKFRKNC